MTITEVIQQLKISTHPVARLLHKTDFCKVLIIGSNTGMILKEHKTQVGGKLIVLSGRVIYKQDNIEKELMQYDEIIIPPKIIHSAKAIENALCLLCL